MLKTLVLAATIAASLTVGGPEAHAAVVRAECHIGATAQETLTGGQDTFTGAGYGYALFDDQGSHTLRCYVTVDGSEVTTTPTGSGSAFVHTEGQVTYNAPEGSTVEVCTEIDGVTIGCAAASTTTLPPQEVQDLAAQLFQVLNSLLCARRQARSECPPYTVHAGVLDPTVSSVICPTLQSLYPGIPGVVDIDWDGDTTVQPLGPRWDCPPLGRP
jgi:hypothetical protein